MDDVNLYVELSTYQVRACRRRYIYILEYMDGDETATAEKHTGVGESVSMKRAMLTAILRGVCRIRRPSEVRVYTPTPCHDILAPLKNGQYRRWKGGGFLTSKGEPVRNADLWQQLEGAMGRHLWGEEHTGHTYRQLMQYELGKMAEHDKTKGGNA